jgi:hypothetical protein
MKLLEFTDDIWRNFKHPNGTKASIKVSNCRLNFVIKKPNQKESKGGGTKFSVEDAQNIANKKIREWLKKGFTEIESTPAIQFDLKANVIEVFRSVKGSIHPPTNGDPLFDFSAVSNEPNLYSYHNVVVNSVPFSTDFIFCSDDLTKGVRFRTGKVNPREDTPDKILKRDKMANQLVKVIKQLKDEILADNTTPVRKLPLNTPIGEFTHLAVLSPTVHNQNYPGTETIGRSVWFAFLCFDVELNENDSVSTGDARTKGSNSIPYINWNRKPHFVFDLRNVKNIDKPEKDPFLIYKPRFLERLLSTKALSNTKYKAIDIRNYKGEICRFLPNQVLTETDMEEIQLFFTQ